MLFALNKAHDRIFAEDASTTDEYFCPYCSSKLTLDSSGKHFLHCSAADCCDSWEKDYDTSLWHDKYQMSFPKKNQEIKISNGDEVHRADILIDKTVIIFSHSLIKNEVFENRNTFFTSLGYKLIWLIDLSDLYKKKKITPICKEQNFKFIFENNSKVFSQYSTQFSNVDLFFKLSSEEKSIVRVYSFKGHNVFSSSDYMNFDGFKKYTGYKSSHCPAPYLMDTASDNDYIEFKNQYRLKLNPQQERAVRCIDGANLLLAVPGSGKTTVLVTRIGYMILKKHISPYNILSLTYNVAASQDMKERFISLFGSCTNVIPQFRTINSIALEIYRVYCKKRNFKERTMLEEKERSKILRQIYIDVSRNVLISDNDVKFLSSNFTYIKNMGLSQDEISEFNKEMPKFDEMYAAYKAYLKSNYKMDFDDQLLFAQWILQTNPDILNMYRERYRYVCVDEAQDTSKIQHEIIYLLAKDSNIFMVGDEDQSIYGFRAAYPKALLEFRLNYPNSYIQKMEYNYRSTPSITQKALCFISENSGRYEKNIIPTREETGEVKKIIAPNRKMQYEILLEKAKVRKDKTAFLYRDNASSIILADLFLRSDIPFVHKKADINFFETKTVSDMLAYLRLTYNPNDIDAFSRVCNKGILFIKNILKSDVIKLMQKNNIPYYTAIYKLFPNLDSRTRSSLTKGITTLKNLTYYESPSSIISQIRISGYDKYLSTQKISKNNIDVLEILSKSEKTLASFLERIKFLEYAIQDMQSKKDNPIILSTIHSSKGLEYDTVYMVDVFDGVFPFAAPSSDPQKELSQEELEERRLFYVGITRAKNNLYLLSIADCKSSYIDELFPIEGNNKNSSSIYNQDIKKRRLMMQNKKIIDSRCYNEVRGKFKSSNKKTQTDSLGRTWVKCDSCGKIKLAMYFSEYSENGKSQCLKCAKQ